MSYDIERVKVGREPVVVGELGIDTCLKIYGTTSTNLLTYSEQFSHANWAGSNPATVTDNTHYGPTGEKTADTIADVSATLYETCYQNLTSVSTTNPYALSIFIRKDNDETRFPLIQGFFKGSTYERNEVMFNTKTGDFKIMFGSPVVSIDELYDYWRIKFVIQSGDTLNNEVGMVIYPAMGTVWGSISIAAQGSIVAWGAQIEYAGTVGHYTPTTTVSASSSCAAAGASGSECYNTRKTCQDVANYLKAHGLYRIAQPIEGLPVTVKMLPIIEGKPRFAPVKITPGKGLGYRAVVNIRLKDFPYHDRGIDPYVATRSYAPEEQGTYWGKFLARNPYYKGRVMRIRAGYITDPWDWANFQDAVFIIDEISGPDKNGYVTITGKDPLTVADDDRAQCPAPSTGVLAAGISDVAGSLTLSPTGIGNSEYPASGTGRIGSEEVTFTRAGDVVTLTARHVNGTAADTHDAGDVFQLAKVWSAVNVIDVIDDLLNNYVDGFDTSWIPYDQGISGPATGTNDEWDDEKGFYLSSADVTRTLSKPTGVNKLISELTEQFLFNIYWHETDQEVKIKAIAPPKANAAVLQFNDDSNVIADSLKLTTDEKQRVSRVWVYYNKIDNSEDGKPENYHNLYGGLDLPQESGDLFGNKQVQEIMADWIPSQALAAQLAGRILARFFEPPKFVRFFIDAKDATIKPGDLFDLTTRFIQDETGAKERTRFEVLQIDEKEQGHRFEVEGMISNFNGLYGFIGPDTLGDYSSETDANRQAYAFICPDSGVFADGTNGYKII